jgi:hypothetical protein
LPIAENVVLADNRPMRAPRSSLTLLLAAALMAACTAPLQPATPPLVAQATSLGSWDSGGCPARANDLSAKYPEAHSPVMEQRLASQFPVGTPEAELMAALDRQGFRATTACDNDPTIHRALFVQSGGSGFGPLPARARVAWKVDGQGRILWTKANVVYEGF